MALYKIEGNLENRTRTIVQGCRAQAELLHPILVLPVDLLYECQTEGHT